MSVFDTLASEVGEWSEENFPNQPTINPFLGTGEEAGELATAIDFENSPDDEELDAVGDILVYLADFCYKRQLNYAEAREQARGMTVEHESFFREWTAVRGRLERSLLKQRQGIRLDEDRVGKEAEQEAVARMFCCLDHLARTRGYTLEDAVNAAWYDEVIDREWDSSYKEN